MDWDNVIADERCILPVHRTLGRGGNAIDRIVIHYNDGDLSIAGAFNVWLTRVASAHYQVDSAGRIGQVVWDKDTAWHAGVWWVNQCSLGIEHANQGDRITDECLESGAHLVAALCRYYDLGRPEWGANVFGHSDFSPTACPGPLSYGRPQHDEYMDRAGYWYDVMTGARSAAPEGEEEVTDEDVERIAQRTRSLVWGFNWGAEYGNERDAARSNVYNRLADMYDVLVPYMGWQYRNADAGDKVDMHQMLVEVHKSTRDLDARLRAIEDKLGPSKE